MPFLRDLLIETKDGEWGQADAGCDTVAMRVVRGTDFDNFRVGHIDSLPIRHVVIRHAQRKALAADDIIIETAGGSKNRPTGRTVLVTTKRVASSDLPLIAASFARFLRVNCALVCPRFVFWKLQALYADGTLRKYHTQHTGVSRFQFTTFATQEPIDFPDRVTQEKIASILSGYDNLIENNTRRIAILEEMARRVYEEWFVHFRAPGCDVSRFTESPLPSGWQPSSIGDAFEILGGGTPSKLKSGYWEGGRINWFTPSDLTRSRTHFLDASGSQITELGLQKSSARLFPAFSVMMTSRATLGVFAINTTPAATNQGFITCLPNTEVPLYWLYFYLRHNADEFERHASGATFKEITKGTFKKLPIALPPVALRHAFQRFAEPIMTLVLNLERQSRKLRAQRDLLLPKLISGKIDVTSAERVMEAAE